MSNNHFGLPVRRMAALAVVGASIVTALAVTLPGTADASSGGPDVVRHTISHKVALTDDGPADQTLSAVVYEPKDQRARGIQVMIPGATYDHRYYDLNSRVSQAREAAEDGWIAVAVDRLGTGRSSQPAADKLNGATHAATIHQLVTKLRTIYKDLPVALVGHSLGSTIAIEEAAHYKDVDAVVTTGFLHHSGAAGGLLGTLLHPAAEDPEFTDRSTVPAGYLTTRDGLRHLFYWPFNADLRTVEADAAAKQTTTASEVTGFVTEQNDDTFAKEVTVPVLAAVGEHDLFFFDPADRPKAVAEEPHAYPASPEADTKVVPDAGHDLALQRNADTTTAFIDTWLSRKIRP
ncbi:alpha/beta hydrolase [Streptomyces justiciae]|uniref:alpha/beta hydrolase n=1 Tax=Streptomyces justiciae TaxID=2780140 RepID=UPI001881142D|nr:alpha/beta hydrolase [Streptomyces justiciae]MBE8473820.1 alpha/beta hydrolase [Streptomyces justiciae]